MTTTTPLPPLMPWNGFRLDDDISYCRATRLITEILADDGWHSQRDVVKQVAAAEVDLKITSITNLIHRLIEHGDIRRKGGKHARLIRLTTRWQGWSE